MPIRNSEIADMFDEIADLLEIKGDNPFRVRAYRNAARVISGLAQSAEALCRDGADLTEFPGIGKDLAGKIKEIVETGRLSMLEELRGRIPSGLNELMKIGGLGPKRILTLHQQLGIRSIEDLKKAVEEKKISRLRGFGEKIERTVAEDLKRAGGEEKRIKISEAEEIAQEILAYLGAARGVRKLIVAGSYRRRRETVADLDILATAEADSDIMERFINYRQTARIVSHGETRSSISLRKGPNIDLRVVPEESYGAALHYFTGSKAHNIAVRKIGVKKGLKINEYGIFRGNRRLAGENEEEVFRCAGLPLIPPELREDRGEIEAALKGQLPHLVELADIKGDLHVHTSVTDGRNTLPEMAEAGAALGYEYLAVTEHSKRVAVARGLKPAELLKRIREIDRYNQKSPVPVLKGIEVDILEDGTLDLPDEVLKELDLTVCSIHYKFNLPREQQTERIIRAMDNPYFNILGHPTGRLLGARKPYEIDMERLLRAAKERGCFMELNSYPDRLDLTDSHCRMAREMGVKISIATDAHSTGDLRYMKYGIGQGRRGWLEPGDVLNTRSWGELKKILKRK